MSGNQINDGEELFQYFRRLQNESFWIWELISPEPIRLSSIFDQIRDVAGGISTLEFRLRWRMPELGLEAEKLMEQTKVAADNFRILYHRLDYWIRQVCWYNEIFLKNCAEVQINSAQGEMRLIGIEACLYDYQQMTDDHMGNIVGTVNSLKTCVSNLLQGIERFQQNQPAASDFILDKEIRRSLADIHELRFGLQYLDQNLKRTHRNSSLLSKLADVEQKSEQLEAQNAVYLDQLAKKSSDIHNLQETLDASKRNNDDLLQRIRGVEKNSSEQIQQCQKSQEERREKDVSILEQHKIELQKQVLDLQQRLESCKSLNQSLVSDHADGIERIHTKGGSEIKELKETISRFEKSIPTRLETTTRAQQEDQDRLMQLQTENDALTSSVAQHSKENDRLHQDLVELQATNDTLREDHQELANDFRELRQSTIDQNAHHREIVLL